MERKEGSGRQATWATRQGASWRQWAGASLILLYYHSPSSSPMRSVPLHLCYFLEMGELSVSFSRLHRKGLTLPLSLLMHSLSLHEFHFGDGQCWGWAFNLSLSILILQFSHLFDGEAF